MGEVIVSDFEKYSPFEVPLSILKKFGVWSEKKESTVHRLKRLIKRTLCLELFIIAQFAYFFDYESNEDLAFALCQFPSCVGIFLKAVNFSLKKPDIDELLTMTKELYDKFPVKPSLLRRLSIASKVTKFCFASLTAAVISCTVGSAFNLPVRTWTPFDVKNSQVGYWVTVLFQLTGLFKFNCCHNLNVKCTFILFLPDQSAAFRLHLGVDEPARSGLFVLQCRLP